jgi:hypothetical protein
MLCHILEIQLPQEFRIEHDAFQTIHLAGVWLRKSFVSIERHSVGNVGLVELVVGVMSASFQPIGSEEIQPTPVIPN